MDLTLTITIPAELNARLHAVPHDAETLGDKILRLLKAGIEEAERQAAEDAAREWYRSRMK